MQYWRWYPTVTTLGDGNALVTAGQKYGSPVITGGGPIHADIPELYHATTNTWQPLSNTASRVLPLYPLMFLAPDGQVFNAGPNSDTKFLNPNSYAIGTAAQTWGTTYYSYYGLTRGYGTAVMYSPGKIFLVGGAGATSVTNTAELINITTSGVATFLPAASMGVARTHANAIILPDGTVLMTGGCSRNLNDETDAVLIPELWTPPSSSSSEGTWARMNEMAAPRLYHSTAVLLPDATVLTTGGGQGGNFPEHHDYQIFTPPYLCKGLPRPEISSAPQAVMYGQSSL